MSQTLNEEVRDLPESSVSISPSEIRSPSKSSGRVKPKKIGKSIAQYAGLVVMAIALLGPFVWTLMTALKGQNDQTFSNPPQFFPTDPTLDNFVKVFESLPVLQFAGNSLVVAIISTACNVIFGAMAGFALARLKFRGNNLVFILFIATIVIPFEVIFASAFMFMRELNLINTFAGIILPSAVTGLSIMLMRTAFLSLPAAVDEAAVLDGASDWQRFWHVSLPSVRGTLSVVAIFAFMFSWDDFLWPQLIAQDESVMTLTVGLTRLTGAFAGDQKAVAAGTMIAVIPLIIAFFALQKYFFKGAGDGAVKG